MARTRTRGGLRAGELRWRFGLVLGLLAMIGAMVVAVRRGTEAREFSREIGRLTERAGSARGRVAAAMVRTDSLGSRARMLVAAGKLGLRPAEDSEITFLRDPVGGKDAEGK